MFAGNVVNAMNECRVKPEREDLCAVMVIVVDEENPPPVGGSINWDKEKEEWKVDVQVTESEPYVEG
jgi:hypothetical protein